MHLPHNMSLDMVRDLRFLTLIEESCREIIGLVGEGKIIKHNSIERHGGSQVVAIGPETQAHPSRYKILFWTAPCSPEHDFDY